MLNQHMLLPLFANPSHPDYFNLPQGPIKELLHHLRKFLNWTPQAYMSFQHLGKSSETLPKLNRDPTNHDMHFIEVIDYLWGRCLGWLYTVTLQIDETSLHCSGDEIAILQTESYFKVYES